MCEAIRRANLVLQSCKSVAWEPGIGIFSVPYDGFLWQQVAHQSKQSRAISGQNLCVEEWGSWKGLRPGRRRRGLMSGSGCGPFAQSGDHDGKPSPQWQYASWLPVQLFSSVPGKAKCAPEDSPPEGRSFSTVASVYLEVILKLLVRSKDLLSRLLRSLCSLQLNCKHLAVALIVSCAILARQPPLCQNRLPKRPPLGQTVSSSMALWESALKPASGRHRATIATEVVRMDLDNQALRPAVLPVTTEPSTSYDSVDSTRRAVSGRRGCFSEPSVHFAARIVPAPGAGAQSTDGAVWDSVVKPVPVQKGLPGQGWVPEVTQVRRSNRDGNWGGVLLVRGRGRKKSNSFVRLAAERVGPSVVRLDTEKPAGPASWWWFWSDMLGGKKDRRERGQGSGFVWDGQAGMIITNAHVVHGADQVKVTFTNGKTLEGVVSGTDDLTDLAVVKVFLRANEVLPAAPLGDSDTLEIGDWVIAVGNPFGLDNTITLGIVSNLHRTSAEVGIPDKRLEFLQTDCAINPGNSGGPLLNEFGEVIGINTAIRVDAEGIGFAIPINKARKIVDVLGEGRPVPHAYLGIQMVTLTPDVARQYNVDPMLSGVVVVQVNPESPAMGLLQYGDVILEMKGRPMLTTGQLQQCVEDSQVGQTLRMRVRREEKVLDVDVVTGDMTPFWPSGPDRRSSEGRSSDRDALGGLVRPPRGGFGRKE